LWIAAEEPFLDDSCDPYGEAKGFCHEVEVVWSSRASESELPGMRDVAAALVCVVAGKEKLLRGKLAMTGKGRSSAACCQIATPLSKEWSAALLKRESLCQKVMDLKSNEHERTSVKE
jgi:hypothetical protein